MPCLFTVLMTGCAAHAVPAGHAHGPAAGTVGGYAQISRSWACVGVLPASHSGEACASGGLGGSVEDGDSFASDVEGGRVRTLQAGTMKYGARGATDFDCAVLGRGTVCCAGKRDCLLCWEEGLFAVLTESGFLFVRCCIAPGYML